MKKNAKIWIWFFAILLIVSSIISLAISIPLELGSGWAIVISLAIGLTFAVPTLIKAWTIVPQQWDYIVEIFGQYVGEPLKPKLYLLFPWFGFVKIRNSAFKGQQLMELYLDEGVKVGFGGGDVEFKDCSTSVAAFFYFQIVDSEKSTYATNDLFRAIEEKADGILRSFLGVYKLEEVIEMKNNFYLEAIAMFIDFRPANLPEGQIGSKPAEEIKREWVNSEFYTTLMSWGIKPVSMVISDIELTERLSSIRETVLTAEKDRETAEIKKKTMIIEAEASKAARILLAEGEKEARVLSAQGEKEALILNGEGSALRIKKIIDSGINRNQVSNFLVKHRQWEAIEKSGSTDKVIILEGGNNSAAQGAKLGAGINSTYKH
jgi:regulator of protease activity HflC (stomatin/prohibitin superfamily)